MSPLARTNLDCHVNWAQSGGTGSKVSRLDSCNPIPASYPDRSQSVKSVFSLQACREEGGCCHRRSRHYGYSWMNREYGKTMCPLRASRGDIDLLTIQGFPPFGHPEPSMSQDVKLRLGSQVSAAKGETTRGCAVNWVIMLIVRDAPTLL